MKSNFINNSDEIDMGEIIQIKVEQAEFEKWKDFLIELNDYGDIIVNFYQEQQFNEDKSIGKSEWYTIDILCDIQQYIDMIPKLIKLDDEHDMVSVWGKYEDLENLLYDDEDEDE